MKVTELRACGLLDVSCRTLTKKTLEGENERVGNEAVWETERVDTDTEGENERVDNETEGESERVDTETENERVDNETKGESERVDTETEGQNERVDNESCFSRQWKLAPIKLIHRYPVTLSTKNQWTWGNPQETAFINLKQILSTNQILISADASAYELGTVLRQLQSNATCRMYFKSTHRNRTKICTNRKGSTPRNVGM